MVVGSDSSKVHIRGLSSQESVGFDSGEGISYNIVHTTYVANSGGELGNVVEVTSLSGRVLIGSIVQSIGERLVIGQHVEWSGFEEMSEMFDG